MDAEAKNFRTLKEQNKLFARLKPSGLAGKGINH
jgi:hypothetical protein